MHVGRNGLKLMVVAREIKMTKQIEKKKGIS